MKDIPVLDSLFNLKPFNYQLWHVLAVSPIRLVALALVLYSVKKLKLLLFLGVTNQVVQCSTTRKHAFKA